MSDGRNGAGPAATIGRYEIVGQFATGGMAEVLLGRLRGPSGFERPVAVKRILPHLAEDPRFVDMFLDEARLAARIQHENVVQVIDLGHSGDDLYLVMEYLEGENLAALIKRSLALGKPVSPGLAAHVGAEVCAGLHAAHELRGDDGAPLGVVHRDVSPQNVLVTYAGGVKVLDLGVAKALGRGTPGTEAGQLKGKVEYLSPEQALGRPLDRRSDLFSLGIVLHELVCRRRLFRRGSVLAALQAIVREPPPPPRSAAPHCPPSLEGVILKALAKDPDHRYATAAEMRRDLLAVVHETLGPEDPRQALAALMDELFRERAAEKREMLRRVRAGDRHPPVPVSEPDASIEIPELVTPPARAPGESLVPLDPGTTRDAPTLAIAERPAAFGEVGAPGPRTDGPGVLERVEAPPAATSDRPAGLDGVVPHALDRRPAEHADLEALVTEAVARFGAAGTAIVEQSSLRLVGAGPEVSVDLGAALDHWGTLAPELRQRRATDLARRLLQARRAALAPGGTRKRFALPRFVAPLAILGVGALGIAVAFRYLAPGGASSARRDPTGGAATTTNADEYERQRSERARRVCEATQARILRGATVGPTDVEGWVVELALARSAAGPADDPALRTFIQRPDGGAGRLVWQDAPEITGQTAIGAEVAVHAEDVPLASARHGVRLTFSGKYVTPYFHPAERSAYLRLASAVADALAASHGALYARCARGSTHHLGAWFLGPSPGGAAASLIYWIGAFADPPHVRQGVLLAEDAGADAAPGGVLDRIAAQARTLDRARLRAVVGAHGGMVAGKGDGRTTLTFPFADSNRAARGSLETAQAVGVAVER